MNDVHEDVLRELGNIGSGNAVTSISKLLSRRIDMTAPKVALLGFDEIANYIGGPTNLLIATLTNLSGEVNGMMIFCIEHDTSHNFINALIGSKYPSSEQLELSLLQEIGNIVAGSYVASLATVTNLDIRISVPNLVIDMAGAILSIPAIEHAHLSDHILFIDTLFLTDDDSISGYFLLVPDEFSFDTIMKSLGV